MAPEKREAGAAEEDKRNGRLVVGCDRLSSLSQGCAAEMAAERLMWRDEVEAAGNTRGVSPELLFN
jgi:hypothetical protein